MWPVWGGAGFLAGFVGTWGKWVLLGTPCPRQPLGKGREMAAVGSGVAGSAQGLMGSGAKVALQAISKWIPKEPLITKARRDN